MYDEEIRELLELYELDELFEVLEIDPYDVIEILLMGGHVSLPPFLERDVLVE